LLKSLKTAFGSLLPAEPSADCLRLIIGNGNYHRELLGIPLHKIKNLASFLIKCLLVSLPYFPKSEDIQKNEKTAKENYCLKVYIYRYKLNCNCCGKKIIHLQSKGEFYKSESFFSFR
jgi:hypothetical protein